MPDGNFYCPRSASGSWYVHGSSDSVTGLVVCNMITYLIHLFVSEPQYYDMCAKVKATNWYKVEKWPGKDPVLVCYDEKWKAIKVQLSVNKK